MERHAVLRELQGRLVSPVRQSVGACVFRRVQPSAFDRRVHERKITGARQAFRRHLALPVQQTATLQILTNRARRGHRKLLHFSGHSQDFADEDLRLLLYSELFTEHFSKRLTEHFNEIFTEKFTENFTENFTEISSELCQEASRKVCAAN